MKIAVKSGQRPGEWIATMQARSWEHARRAADYVREHPPRAYRLQRNAIARRGGKNSTGRAVDLTLYLRWMNHEEPAMLYGGVHVYLKPVLGIAGARESADA